MDQSDLEKTVIEGLSRTPPRLPHKLFYDRDGSILFDQICELPEYYLTRAEIEILETYGAEIAAALGPRAVLVELGSGSSTKTRLLLDSLPDLHRYVPVDISAEHLHEAAEALRAAHPGLEVEPLVYDYSRTMPDVSALRDAPEGSRVTVFFSGSSIGNFDRDHASRFLDGMARMAGPDGRVLVAADLRKDPALLEAAYDDSAGVTAAFNQNVLERLNRDLGADFDRDAWRHRAVWRDAESRIEMRLVSTRQQQVTIGARKLEFREGEFIVTEHCHKYTVEDFGCLAASAGLVTRKTWLDAQGRFSLHLLAREPSV